MTTSAPLTVVVNPNLPPTATLAPVSGVFKIGSTLNLTGTAVDPENALAHAQIYSNGSFMAEMTALGSGNYGFLECDNSGNITLVAT